MTSRQPDGLSLRVPWTPEVERELMQGVTAARSALMPTLGKPGVRYFVSFQMRSDSAYLEVELLPAGHD